MWAPPREACRAIGLPNAYPGAGPGFAPYTTFDSTGDVTGGFGLENRHRGYRHSTYHALQTSLSGAREARRAGHPGQLHVEQIHRRHQRGGRRNRLDRRGRV